VMEGEKYENKKDCIFGPDFHIVSLRML